MSAKLEILNVDADVDARARLKQMILAHEPNVKIVVATRLAEAVTRVESGGEFDLMIVSSAFGMDTLRPFIEKIKCFSGARDMVIVAILRGRHADTTTVVQNLLSGIHGCLCEPFSVDNLSELIVQAKTSRGIREQRKRLLAVEFILNDAVKYLDEIAKRQAQGESFRYMLKSLKKLCAPLPGLGKEVEADFAEAAVKRFTAIRAPRYTVKKRVEEQVAQATTTQAATGSSRRIIRKG